MTDQRDQLYRQPLSQIGDFSFDEHVVDVFPNMIQRSVPGYGSLLRMLVYLAQQTVRPNTLCYDLGCSLGACSLAISTGVQAAELPADAVKIIAMDNSVAMIKRFRDNNERSYVPIDIRHGDICKLNITNASLVVMNYTLQFIPPADRTALLANIYTGLNSGGVLMLSEKIHCANADMNDRFIDLHHRFKQANGYSALEVAQKRTAIEKVLVPDTLACHQARLKAVGFSRCEVWYQCFNFMSILAIK